MSQEQKPRVNKDTKITISVGCVEYLIEEVESKRKRVELLSIETHVMNNFFNMVNKLAPPPDRGYSPDDLYQAKKEFGEAVKNAEAE